MATSNGTTRSRRHTASSSSDTLGRVGDHQRQVDGSNDLPLIRFRAVMVSPPVKPFHPRLSSRRLRPDSVRTASRSPRNAISRRGADVLSAVVHEQFRCGHVGVVAEREYHRLVERALTVSALPVGR